MTIASLSFTLLYDTQEIMYHDIPDTHILVSSAMYIDTTTIALKTVYGTITAARQAYFA